MPRALFALLLTALLSLAAAQEGFMWSPDTFPEGDQSYVLEVVSGGDLEGMQLSIDIVQTETGYDVTTTIVSSQTGLTQGDLSGAAFGGSMLGGLAFGPMMFYGPAFMMLPLMLGQEEIRVRSEPMVVMGMGSLVMDSTIEIAGKTCVEIRFEPNDDPESILEFALAEGVPFPCYSRFGSGDGAVEMRLVEATP